MVEELEICIQHSLLQFYSTRAVPSPHRDRKLLNLDVSVPEELLCLFVPYSSGSVLQLVPEETTGPETVVLVRHEYRMDSVSVKVWHGMASDGTILYALGKAS